MIEHVISGSLSAPLSGGRSYPAAAVHPCRLRPIAPPPEHETPRLWFAILTFNALAYTKRCLASLDRHTAQPWHAVILDNTSTDGTRDWLSTLHDPRITVELGSSNLGVAGGRNRLLDLMLHRVPEDGFVVFVDNDLEFYPDWTAPFLSLFGSQPNAGMASVSGHEIVVHGSRRELLSLPGHASMPVDVASGGFACFVRPAVFQAIGRYDEALNPFWHEDDDISVRTLVAGWDVYAVPAAPVVHHGHKSGVALPSLIQGGSLDKQRYLVEKWRALGIIRPDGRLDYGRPDDELPMAARLGERLHRAGALRRSEYERADLDLLLLADSMERTGGVADRTRYVSTPALALLEDRVELGRSDTNGFALLAAMRHLLESRRRATRLPIATTATARALTRLADATDWDDASWFADAVAYAGDGRGAQQWYDRSLATWRMTQAAHALRALSLVHPAARILLVSELRSPLVWGLARDVGELVVADLLDRYPGAATGRWLNDPDRLATQAVPAGRVRAVGFEYLLDEVPAASFDAAVLFPWNPAMAYAELGTLLSAVASRVAPGGAVLSCVPVRLAGPPQPGMLEMPSAAHRWVASLGLELRGGTDFALSDAGLLAATDAAWSHARTPDLLVADGARLAGQLFIAAGVPS